MAVDPNHNQGNAGQARETRPPFDDRDLIEAAGELGNPHPRALGGGEDPNLPGNRFNRIRHEVQQQAAAEYRRENLQPLPPLASSARHADAERERRTRFERANAHVQLLKQAHALRHENDAPVEERRDQAEADAQKELERIRKEVERQSGRNMGLLQREAVRIAGNRAMGVLIEVAEDLAARVNGGGVEAYFIIGLTFVAALLKDGADIVLAMADLTGVGVVVGWAVGALIGIACSVFIIIFWMFVDGTDWHGGAARNSVFRMGMRRLIVWLVGAAIDSAPVVKAAPIFLLLNTLSFIQYLYAKRKAAEELEEVNGQMEQLERNVRTEMDRIAS